MEIKADRMKLVPCTEDNINKYAHNYNLGPHIQMYQNELKVDPTCIGWGPWLVLLDEEVIGDLGFKGKPNADLDVEIDYAITPKNQNKGYATEAVHSLIEWAFLNKVEKVRAECSSSNVGSIKVLQKLGMRQAEEIDNMLYWELKRNEICR